MAGFFERLDEVAGVQGGMAVVWLERVAFVFLVLTFAAAPHSIAATQTAWIAGTLAWVVRLFLTPRVRFRLGWLDAALWGLFAWSVISSLVSYEPLVSLDKLRGAAVFLIFYFVFYNVRTRKAAALLAFVMIGSCMVNVLWMPIERAIGRGVEIKELNPESPLAKALLQEGDTLLEVDRQKVSTPEEVVAAIERTDTSRVKFYRPDFEYAVVVQRSDLLPGTDGLQRLGISGWKKSHNWRSKGFYGHYTTYAEVLQLIGSLALGLFVAAMGRNGKRTGDSHGTDKRWPLSSIVANFKSPGVVALAVAVIGIAFALLLTVTRAPQLAFVISAAVIVFFGLRRKWFLIAMLVLLPVAAGGLIFLQQSRNVEFIDREDESTRYRQMMWRDGVRLWTESPRHFVFGVGMDSIKEHWREWDMFEGGKQPLGHFHSTPLQLAVERGLPALVLWLLTVGLFARSLIYGHGGAGKRQVATAPGSGIWSRGILLGGFGGLLGFFVSGLVHYNLGDQEVAMVFFIIMGLGLAVGKMSDEENAERPSSAAAVRLAA